MLLYICSTLKQLSKQVLPFVCLHGSHQYHFSFVEAPRKFIIAIINLRKTKMMGDILLSTSVKIIQHSPKVVVFFLLCLVDRLSRKNMGFFPSDVCE